MKHFVSIIVATKDRPEDLGRLLRSLSQQTRRPDQVILIDASEHPVEPVVRGFELLNCTYHRHLPPSAAAQRNAGMGFCDARTTLVGFVDDDTIFELDSFEQMLQFWAEADETLVGAAFNLLNYEMPAGQWLKRSWLANRLGLYAAAPGAVARSGWQSVFGRVAHDFYTEWLPTTAILLRTCVLKNCGFDEFFTGYSYLEDLDLSYGLSRKGKLAIVAQAGYSHFPSAAGRISQRSFGRVEVRNRLYFVRKHRLSLWRCYLSVAIRMLLSLNSALTHPDRGHLSRLAGNLDALLGAKRQELSAGSCCRPGDTLS